MGSEYLLLGFYYYTNTETGYLLTILKIDLIVLLHLVSFSSVIEKIDIIGNLSLWQEN